MHTSVRNNGQERFTSGERIAESILELLDEPDSSDKSWRAPIFRQLPKRFAEIVAHDYKETYIFDGRHHANLSLLETYGPITKNSIPLNASDDDLKDLAKNIVKEMQQISRIYQNLEYAVSRILHRAKKYEISLPSRDNPNIVNQHSKFTRYQHPKVTSCMYYNLVVERVIAMLKSIGIVTGFKDVAVMSDAIE